MRKYKTIPKTIKAQQYFAGMEIAIDGFENIEETFIDQATSQLAVIVRKAEISRNGGKVTLTKGDWLIEYEDESVDVMPAAVFPNMYQLDE